MAKTIQEAGENLKQAADRGIIGPRYIAGIRKADWKTAAGSQAAAANYASGVQAAIAEGRYTSGINAVSNEQWRTASEQKGGAVIGQRVSASIDKYNRNFGPILSAMNSASASLPPRTTSPSQNIQNRMIPIVRAAVEAAGKTFS